MHFIWPCHWIIGGAKFVPESSLPFSYRYKPGTEGSYKHGNELFGHQVNALLFNFTNE